MDLAGHPEKITLLLHSWFSILTEWWSVSTHKVLKVLTCLKTVGSSLAKESWQWGKGNEKI